MLPDVGLRPPAATVASLVASTDDELSDSVAARSASLIASAISGEGRVVLLGGGAGLGKSRLIEALGDLVQEAGGRVIRCK